MIKQAALLLGSALVGCGDGTLITVGHVQPPITEGGVVQPPPKSDASMELDGAIGVCTQCSTCEAGVKTTVTGLIYDPAGQVPLYNVIVYVPKDATLAPVADGLSCDICASTVVNPRASALTDPSGRFLLEDVPVGNDIPLVIQIGRWRRQVTIPTVVACKENPIDPEMTRLPRNSTEGHLPQIALTTGHSDALECLLRRIGIDDREFTTDAGSGRVHMFVGCDGGSGVPANQFAPALGGAKFPAATSLWSDFGKLSKYDMLVMSCEGSQCEGSKKPNIDNIKRYADNGGRLFLDHLHFYWLRSGPEPWPETADYVGPNQDDLPSPFTAKVDDSFPKGDAFSRWLVQTQASMSPGSIAILGGQFSVRQTTPGITQRWIYTDKNPVDSSGSAVEYMTMNTPTIPELVDAGKIGDAGSDAQCGRVVYTDLHVVAATESDAGSGSGTKDVSRSDVPFPGGCVDGKLTAQEKALEFMLFDLSSCIQLDTDPVTPPPILR
jgi:hypothetical protein